MAESVSPMDYKANHYERFIILSLILIQTAEDATATIWAAESPPQLLQKSKVNNPVK